MMLWEVLRDMKPGDKFTYDDDLEAVCSNDGPLKWTNKGNTAVYASIAFGNRWKKVKPKWEDATYEQAMQVLVAETHDVNVSSCTINDLRIHLCGGVVFFTNETGCDSSINRVYLEPGLTFQIRKKSE